MRCHCQHIPSLHYNNIVKISQVVPEQWINQNVTVYVEAIPYIECELRSTIQHEAAHRKDEESRYNAIQSGRKVQPFSEFSAESRVEPIAEKAEENCESMKPTQLSGKTQEINLAEIFAKAKSNASIDPQYKNDIHAGTLDPKAQGMYLMQDFPSQLTVFTRQNPNIYKGFDGSLWVDVRKIISPFIAKSNMNIPAVDLESTINKTGNPGQNTTPTSGPVVPSVPSVPTIGAR